MVREVNHTLITLISKMKGAEQMEEFRPISCVGAVYKLHAKLLTGRLSIVSLLLISPAQAVFVEGRQLSNHYKLACEMVNGFGRKATPRCFCLLIDLRKAFDTVDWDCIGESLSTLGFSASVHKILRQCYPTTSFSVLVEGEPTVIFSASRGLRQGTLSPHSSSTSLWNP